MASKQGSGGNRAVTAIVGFGAAFVARKVIQLAWKQITGKEPPEPEDPQVALDEARTRALRGPSADPRAFMLIRPYLKYAVYIEVTAEHQDRPYWLIGTRRPAELAAAIERSRPQARADGTPVG